MADFNIDEMCKRFNISELKEPQKQSIAAVLAGKDVFVGTRTGSGKSLTYEAIPALIPNSTVIVIAPLITIMSEQCQKLNSLGFSSTYIGRNQEDDDLITSGQFNYVFCSPENLVGESKWRNMLTSDVYQNKLKALVVDEAHTVLHWGEASHGEEPFREWFAKIGEIRSLCPTVPMIALTATSGPLQRKKITKSLNFNPSNTETIIDSPDRPNIKISSKTVPNKDNFDEAFTWLVKELQKAGRSLKRYVIFAETITTVSRIYGYLIGIFGKRSSLIEMYHSKTVENKKEKIRTDMAADGDIRILVCTNAAGMGVNFFGVNNVIHYGLPHDMDTFVQQMGRGGRDGSFAEELVLWKTHKTQLKKVEPDLVRLVKDNVCRRELLCSSYLVKASQVDPVHNCCDICEKDCDCGADVCPQKHIALLTDDESDSSSEGEMERQVSQSDRQLLKQKLHGYYLSLTEASSNNLVQPDVLHGLTIELIDNIVEKCEHIRSVGDIIKHFPIWSFNIAEDLYSVFVTVFGDSDKSDSLDSDASSGREVSDLSDTPSLM